MENKNFNQLLAIMQAHQNAKQQMGLGGQIGAGVAGLASGVAGSLLPGPVGNMAQQGIGAVHGMLDKNIDREEQSIMGFGKAAGAIGTAVATGGTSLAAGADDIASGLGQGIVGGTDFGQKNAGTIQGLSQLAGMAGGMAAGNMPIGGMKAQGGLVQFEGGGTHEQNPNGGIPFGQNASVEDKETAMELDDMSKYVFSDRLKDGKKSFASKSKTIENKFKDRPNDAAAKRAKDQMLKGLAERQETLKAAKMAKLQSKMTELGGEQMQAAAQPMMNGGRVQYPNGGTVASGFQLPEGMNNNLINSFQSYAKANGADLGSTGVDNVYGKMTQGAWDVYGKDFLSMQNELANQQPAQNKQPVDMNSLANEVSGNPGTPLELTPGATGTDLMGHLAGNANTGIGTANPAMNNGENNLNRNASIIGGQALNSAGDIYGLIQGIRGPEDINLDRLNPDMVDLSKQREIARRQAGVASAIQNQNVRNTAQSSGAALSNLGAGNAAINQNLSNLLTQSALDEETRNVGIRNAAQQANQGIDTQEQMLNLQALAKSQEAIQSGLFGLGANAAQGLKDIRMSNSVEGRNEQQLNSINAILKNFTVNKDGSMTFKGA